MSRVVREIRHVIGKGEYPRPMRSAADARASVAAASRRLATAIRSATTREVPRISAACWRLVPLAVDAYRRAPLCGQQTCCAAGEATPLRWSSAVSVLPLHEHAPALDEVDHRHELVVIAAVLSRGLELRVLPLRAESGAHERGVTTSNARPARTGCSSTIRSKRTIVAFSTAASMATASRVVAGACATLWRTIPWWYPRPRTTDSRGQWTRRSIEAATHGSSLMNRSAASLAHCSRCFTN